MARGDGFDPSATKWFFVQQAVTRLVPWLLTVMNHFTGSPKQQGLKNYTSGCHRTSPRSLPEPAGACRSSHPEFLVSQDFGESAVAKRLWHIGPSLWRARKFTLWLFNIAMENGPLIVDFPIKNGGSFNSYVKLPEGSFFFISVVFLFLVPSFSAWSKFILP